MSLQTQVDSLSIPPLSRGGSSGTVRIPPPADSMSLQPQVEGQPSLSIPPLSRGGSSGTIRIPPPADSMSLQPQVGGQPSLSIPPLSHRGSSGTVRIPRPPSPIEVQSMRESVYLTPTTSNVDLLELQTPTSRMPGESSCRSCLSSANLPTYRYLLQRLF